MKIEMKNLNLTYEQNNNLSHELLKLVNLYAKKDEVECIYYIPSCYVGTKELKTINFKIVTSNDEIDFENDIYEYNLKSSNRDNIDKFGVELYLGTDISDRYTLKPIKSNKHYYSQLQRGKWLFNGIILYDKDGKYQSIKSNVQNSIYYPKDYIKKEYPTAIINPSLKVDYFGKILKDIGLIDKCGEKKNIQETEKTMFEFILRNCEKLKSAKMLNEHRHKMDTQPEYAEKIYKILSKTIKKD